MKLIVNYCGRYLASLMTGLALAVTGFAQSNNGPEAPELIDREKEIEMALSAAPEHLRKDAAVYVLQRGGYVKAHEGSNGFTCLVERDGVKNTRDRKKSGGIVEIVQNQKDGRQIAPSRSPLKDLSVCGEVGDLTCGQ